MKKFILIIILLTGLHTSAQQLYAEGGWTISSFDFENSQGLEELDFLQSVTQNYFGVGYRRPFFAKNLQVDFGFTYNSYGAEGTDTVLNNTLEWDVDYVGFNLTFDYKLFSVEDLDFFIKSGASLEWIVKGKQTINNQVFDIKNTEEFEETPLFIRGGAMLTYPVSDRSKLFLKYYYGKSLPLENTTNRGTSDLKIESHMIGLGILMNLAPKKENIEDENPSEENNEQGLK